MAEGITIISSTDTPEQIAAALGINPSQVATEVPPTATPLVPEPTTPAVVAIPAPTPTPAPLAITPTPEPIRDAQGRFTTPRPKDIAQARFDQREAERAARAERARADALAEELAALKAQAPPTPVAVVEPQTFPKWDDWTLLHKDKDYEDYLDERADWRAKERGYVSQADVDRIATEKAQALITAEREAAEQATAEERRRTRELAFFTSQEESKAKHPDYNQIVLNEDADLPTNDTMEVFVRRSGAAAGELLYYLGSHPEDCRRISALADPDEVIEAMTRIKVELEGVRPGPPAAPIPVTRAPAPVEPVGGARTAASVSLDTAGIHDFMRIRNEEERARAGRI